MTWLIVSVVLAALIGVDVLKNPQSYRNVGLRFGDGCRSLWFWPAALIYAHTSGYRPRHAASRGEEIPDFMRTWHLR